MKKKTVNMTSSVLTGMMVGAVAGVMANGLVQSKKKRIKKTTGKAISAVGEMIQNISAYMK